MSLWKFSESVAPERAERLLGYADFDAVIHLLGQAIITGFCKESFRDKELKGCQRASFLLHVAPEAYGAFFNSPVGYRAQYALAVSGGEAANRKLLSALEARLVAYAKACGGWPGSLVCASLRAAEAKLWIRESEVESQMGKDETEILYLPWQNASDDGAGLLAPCGQELEVNGGWLDQDGIVRINPKKAHRGEDIHYKGYS